MAVGCGAELDAGVGWPVGTGVEVELEVGEGFVGDKVAAGADGVLAADEHAVDHLP